MEGLNDGGILSSRKKKRMKGFTEGERESYKRGRRKGKAKAYIEKKYRERRTGTKRQGILQRREEWIE